MTPEDEELRAQFLEALKLFAVDPERGEALVAEFEALLKANPAGGLLAPGDSVH